MPVVIKIHTTIHAFLTDYLLIDINTRYRCFWIPIEMSFLKNDEYFLMKQHLCIVNRKIVSYDFVIIATVVPEVT